MHYEFEAGMIESPTRYRNGLVPRPGLSSRDKQWVRKFYPPLRPADHRELVPFRSVQLGLEPMGQANFSIAPEHTRTYRMATFGASDTVLVLFEKVGRSLRYVAGDDDSGAGYNANIETRLFAGREYVLRARLYYRHRAGDFAIMLW